MPSMRGFLRSKPKSDDGEAELAESQLVARLAGLFGEMAVDTADSDGQHAAEAATNGATLRREVARNGRASNGARPTERPYLGRPPIIVIGEAPIIISGPELDEAEPSDAAEPTEALGALEPLEPVETDPIVEPVGVMAQAGDDVGEDTWQLPARPEPVPVAKSIRKRPSRARRAATTTGSIATAPAAEPETDALPLAELRVEATPTGVPEVEASPEARLDVVPERGADLEGAAAAPAEVEVAPATPPARRSHKKRPVLAAVIGAEPAIEAEPEVPAAGVQAEPVVHPKPVVQAKPVVRARVAVKAKAVVKARPVVISAVHCPYCGVLLDPPPATSRKCDECQQRIIVKRIDGRAVYLAGAALPVFTAERRRVANSARLTRERSRWLELAIAAGSPSRAVAQLRIARASDANVAAARELYLLAVDRACRMAKRDKEWEAAARLRRDEATAIHRADGSPRPPSAEVVELYRDGVASELRGIAEISREAQLVGASCCEACRADDEVVTRIATELRQPRLPHADCPRGLCRCHWDLAARDRTTLLRYLRRRSPSASRATSTETPPAR